MKNGLKRSALRRVAWCALLLWATLPLASCRRAAERAAAKIRIEAVESVERQGLTGFEAVVRVRNGSGYKLVLERARLDLYCDGARAGDIRLGGRVEVGRRTVERVATRWQVRISDPLALYALARRVRRGAAEGIEVSYAVEGRGGPAAVNISRERVPLSEFLRTFGWTLQDVADYLNPKS